MICLKPGMSWLKNGSKNVLHKEFSDGKWGSKCTNKQPLNAAVDLYSGVAAPPKGTAVPCRAKSLEQRRCGWDWNTMAYCAKGMNCYDHTYSLGRYKGNSRMICLKPGMSWLKNGSKNVLHKEFSDGKWGSKCTNKQPLNAAVDLGTYSGYHPPKKGVAIKCKAKSNDKDRCGWVFD